MQQLEAILSLATDLTASIGVKDRYKRLLQVVRSILKTDAATLLAKEGDSLRLVACEGLGDKLLGTRYALKEHPRLEIICGARMPTLFPADSPLPDPFDEYLAHAKPKKAASRRRARVHSCLGCPLLVENELVGVMTADSLEAEAFKRIDLKFLSVLGALAGAALRTGRLVEALEAVAEKRGMVARDLMRSVSESTGSSLLGVTPEIERLREEIRFAAQCELPVLITGETGTGKELVARSVHAQCARSESALIQVNCAALPENIVESELFGHVKGAFTGADSPRAGKFEIADGGTLFLDEVGELPLHVQPKLLRALQEGEIQRVGSDQLRKVNVRVIAATNRDLQEEIRRGRFRADLYYRLNVYPIRVPSLRDHREDIPHLARYFCDLNCRKLNVSAIQLLPETLGILKGNNWPGNVRELRNVLDRTVLKARFLRRNDAVLKIRTADLPQDLQAESRGILTGSLELPESLPVKNASLREATEEFQRKLILASVDSQGGNWAGAAKQLGLHRSNLFALAKRLGLK